MLEPTDIIIKDTQALFIRLLVGTQRKCLTCNDVLTFIEHQPAARLYQTKLQLVSVISLGRPGSA